MTCKKGHGDMEGLCIFMVMVLDRRWDLALYVYNAEKMVDKTCGFAYSK